MSKVRAHRVVGVVKPFAPKWHFLCESEPILVPNVKRHPRHLHFVHIHRRVKMKLRETLLSMTLPYTLYIYMEEGKKLIHFVRHRYSLSLHLNLIFQALSHRRSLSGMNLADRKLWKGINVTFACSEENRGRDRRGGESRRGGKLESGEKVPPKRAGSWGENSDNESPSSTHTGAKDLIHWKAQRKDSSYPGSH